MTLAGRMVLSQSASRGHTTNTAASQPRSVRFIEPHEEEEENIIQRVHQLDIDVQGSESLRTPPSPQNLTPHGPFFLVPTWLFDVKNNPTDYSAKNMRGRVYAAPIIMEDRPLTPPVTKRSANKRRAAQESESPILLRNMETEVEEDVICSQITESFNKCRTLVPNEAIHQSKKRR